MSPCIKCGSIDRNKNGDCKSCQRVSAAARRKNNPDLHRATNASYHKKNKEKINARQAQYYLDNKSKIRNRVAKQRSENIERVRAANALYARSNPEKFAAYARNRYALKINSPGSHCDGDVKKLLVLQRSKCAVCSTCIKDKYHVDHVMPFALGGGNSRENLQLLCPTCNLKKHAKHPVDFMQQLGYLL